MPSVRVDQSFLDPGVVVFQGDVAARKALLHLSESAWADALMELALCERELDDPFAAVATGAATAAATADGASGHLRVRRVFFFAWIANTAAVCCAVRKP